MSKKSKTDYIFAGLFIVTMAGIIFYAFKKNTSGLEDNKRGQQMNSTFSNDEDSVISGISDKIASVIEDGEQKIHKKETRFSMPAGELGLFL
ncbi:MAG: hypothetical protein ABIT07_08195 [Ferruginibacter sp.]